MKTRVLTSIVAIPILLVALAYYHTIWFDAIVTAACMIAIHEVIGAFKLPSSWVLYLMMAPVTAGVMFSFYQPVRAVLPVLLFLTVVVLVFYTVFSFEKIDFAKIAAVVLFCAEVVFGFYSIMYIKAAFPAATCGRDAVFVMALGFGIAWGGDTFAYFVGCSIGKHKLLPKVSPKKSKEGAVGGICGSILLAEVFCLAYDKMLPMLEASPNARLVQGVWLPMIFVAVVGSVMGIMGDLFTSAIKRQCGIKDFGTLFPGHGGILDRFDSVLLVMPFMALVARYLPLVVR